MEDLDDSGLLTTWRAGDQEAFGVLVARYHGLVHAACVRQAAPGDIDDCVQAVFLVLARRPAAAARVPVLAAWLQRVASFVCRRSRRSAERRRRAESTAAAEATASAGRPPEALGHLDECLLRLPEKQRSAVVMHYLAGRSPEEVAASLNTSRENTYQLLSRGLAGLRALLARRGVAVSMTALTGLFAGEAQAAAVPAVPAIAAALSTPSAAATSLATGAITAMSIATMTPFAFAAGLLLAVAATTVALTAEPTALPPPVAATPIGTLSPAASSMVKTPAVLAAWDEMPADPHLEAWASIDFQDTGIQEVMAWMKMVSNMDIAAVPAMTGTLSIRAMDMRLADCLAWFAILADARLAVRDGRVRLEPGVGGPAPLPASTSPADAVVQQKLALMRVTLDFKDQKGTEVATFLAKVSGVSVLVHPRSGLAAAAITLKGKEMVMQDVVRNIASLADCRMVVRNGAVGFLPKDMASPPAQDPVQVPPAVVIPEPAAPTSTF